MRARYPNVSGMQYSFGPGGITPAVKAIIIANVSVFVLMVLTGGAPWIELLGLRPADLFQRFFVWQPLTYMFLHGGLGHIFFNMLLLWFIGVELERMWGTVFFARFYTACGLGAGATQVLLGILPFGFANAFYGVSTIGASGAIYGLLLAYALYFPTRPFLVFLIFPVQARVFVMIMAGISLLLATGGGGGVAHTAHLGGMATAWFYLRGKGMNLNLASEIQYRYLKWKINRMRKKFDVYSGGRRDDWDRKVH